MHWLIVAGCVDPAPVMLLTTVTRQRTMPPPPLAEPLHCSTVLVRSVKDDTVVTQLVAAAAGPRHTVRVPSSSSRRWPG
jgi:hypothetical protein